MYQYFKRQLNLQHVSDLDISVTVHHIYK